MSDDYIDYLKSKIISYTKSMVLGGVVALQLPGVVASVPRVLSFSFWIIVSSIMSVTINRARVWLVLYRERTLVTVSNHKIFISEPFFYREKYS